MFSFLGEINLRAGAQPSTIHRLLEIFLEIKKFKSFQTNLFDDKLHHEFLHNCLCKHLLRVHSKESNFAVKLEVN